METRADIERLLRLQNAAYRLLIAVSKLATQEPQMFPAETMLQLGTRRGCQAWIDQHRDCFPDVTLPSHDDLPDFCALFKSFFCTSFQIECLDFDGKNLATDVRRAKRTVRSNAGNVQHLKATALKHLCAKAGLKVTRTEALSFVSHAELNLSLKIWTYVWELNRRRIGKAKGPVAHALWKSIPVDRRKELSVDDVWDARSKLLQHVREFLAMGENA